MRLVAPTLLILLGAAACSGQQTEAAPEPLAAAATITVGRVHCNNCVSTIEEVVAEVPGAELGYVDLPNQTAQIHLPAGTDKAAVLRRLDAVGHAEVAAPAPSSGP